MKKAIWRKIISTVVASVTVTMLLPLGASAESNNNHDGMWNLESKETSIAGWKSVSGIWYYLNSNGIMQTGWICDKGDWYHLSSSGEMQRGWIIDEGNWYFLNYSGRMEKGWTKENGKWYYLNNHGAMQTGWLMDNEKWYYMDDNGAMKTGTARIADKIYFFNYSGELLQSIANSNGGIVENNSDKTSSSAVDISGLPKLPNNYDISVQAYAEDKILELMNQKRAEAGMNLLTLDSTLVQAARYKSNHMIQYNYFDHTTPEGEKWTNWLDAIGYQYTSTGENIAYNNYDPVELFNQWWNSPGHKANMMNSSFNKVGVGVIEGNGKFMGTQTFSN